MDEDALRPMLAGARQAALGLRAKRGALQEEYMHLAKDRQAATIALEKLAGPPLLEIKALARSPPALVRRTLAATWVMLNCERFTGKLAVSFDEVREWKRVQSMLVKE